MKIAILNGSPRKENTAAMEACLVSFFRKITLIDKRIFLHIYDRNETSFLKMCGEFF